ncbi:hypothetical protein GS946_24295 [Rhodococcus hoagii]|nr:hypothetical protein [Prescottella equi]
MGRHGGTRRGRRESNRHAAPRRVGVARGPGHRQHRGRPRRHPGVARPRLAVVFAVGLLASGLASTSVGCAAGSEIMHGLLKHADPGTHPTSSHPHPRSDRARDRRRSTYALVISQVVLSLCIPFALVPLVRMTSDPEVDGSRTERPAKPPSRGSVSESSRR